MRNNLNIMIVDPDAEFCRVLSDKLTSYYPAAFIYSARSMIDAASSSRKFLPHVFIAGADQLGDGFAFLNNLKGSLEARIMLTSRSDHSAFVPKGFTAVPAYRLEPILAEIDNQLEEQVKQSEQPQYYATISAMQKLGVVVVDVNQKRYDDIEQRLYLTYGNEVHVRNAFGLAGLHECLKERKPNLIIAMDDEENNGMGALRNHVVKASTDIQKIIFLEEGPGTAFVKAEARHLSAKVIIQPDYAKLVAEVGKHVEQSRGAVVHF